MRTLMRSIARVIENAVMIRSPSIASFFYHVSRGTRATNSEIDVRCSPDEDFEIFGDSELPKRALDFSNRILVESSILRNVILESSHVTELNVINSVLTNQDLVGVITELSRLKTLSYTVSGDVPEVPQKHACLRTLYLEADPSARPLTFVVSLMNACEAIRAVHINLIGSESSWSVEPFLPTLEAERWETLHTVVLSSFWSTSNVIRKIFLESIFSHKTSAGISDWIQRNLRCHIYEHGNFNGDDLVPHKVIETDHSLLRDYQYVNTDIDDGECHELHWGYPRSLRLEGSLSVSSIFNLAKNLSPSLVELDLTESHGAYTPEVQLAVLAAASNVEILALSACFFSSLASGSSGLEFLEKSRVREIFIRGNSHSPQCRARSCRCRGLKIPRCEICAESLRSENLPDFAALKNLRALTFNGVKLDDSAYEKLANPEVLTFRLCVSQSTRYGGLQHLLKRCVNVESLKLQSLCMPIRSRGLWASIAQCKKLKQLCVGTRTEDSFPVPEIRRLLLQFPGQLKVVHLHNDADPDKSLQQLADEFSRVLSLDSFGLNVLEDVKHICGIPRIRGRALCCPESRIGIPETRGWRV